jgi:hypothetical protein
MNKTPDADPKPLGKEEIVREEFEKYFAAPPYDKSVNRVMNQAYIFPAMDSWAKIIAVDFAEWVAREEFEVVHLPILWSQKPHSETYTTDQLFNIYLTERNKEK